MLKPLEARLRELKPAEFRRMESAAANATIDLLAAFRDNFSATLRAIASLLAAPNYADAMWRGRLHRLAHDLRGLGGTFDYALITAIGSSLCSLIEHRDLPGDPRLQRHIAAHAAALQAILQFDLKGDGGGHGQELLATLRIDKPKPETATP